MKALQRSDFSLRGNRMATVAGVNPDEARGYCLESANGIRLFTHVERWQSG